ncbi:hypothetical protein [Streptomyces sp. cg36]|uniref:hypothetical protein n=1 Tax=Streptomyces sp. cg36 TaxID=3238798 RepID=UPI0034E1E9CE
MPSATEVQEKTYGNAYEDGAAGTGTQRPLVEEIVLFLSVHRGRRPGLMWLEHEPLDPRVVERSLPSALAHRLARGITELPHLPGEPEYGFTHTPQDLLVCQLGGSDTWHIAPQSGTALTLRVQTGAVLYVPPHALCTRHKSKRSRTLLLALGPGRNADPVAWRVPG